MNATPWTFLQGNDLKPKWIKLIHKEYALTIDGNRNRIKKGIKTLFVLKRATVKTRLLSTDDEFRNIVFKEPIPNKILKNHLIKTEDVPNEGSCRVLCYMDPDCVSINLGPFIQGKHTCQLNNATDKSLANEKGFTHLAIEVTSTFDLSFRAVLWYLSAGRFSCLEGCIWGLVYVPYKHGVTKAYFKKQVAQITSFRFLHEPQARWKEKYNLRINRPSLKLIVIPLKYF